MKQWIFFLILCFGLMESAWTQKPELMITVGHTSDILAVAISPDGNYILTGSMDSMGKLWEVKSGKEVHRFMHLRAVGYVSFSPDGEYVLTVSTFEAKLWDIHSGKEVRSFESKFPIGPVTFSAPCPEEADCPIGNARYILMSSKRSYVWDIQSGEMVSTLGELKLDPKNDAFSDDGRYLFRKSRAENLEVWGTHSGKKRSDLSKLCNDRVTSLVLSPDERFAVAFHHDETASLHEGYAGENQDRSWKKIQAFNSQEERITSIAFSPTNSHMLTRTTTDTEYTSPKTGYKMVLWNPQTGEEVQRFSGNAIHSFTFSQDGKYLLLSRGSGFITKDDGNLKEYHGDMELYDVQRGKLVRSFEEMISKPVASRPLVVSPTGRYLLQANGDHTAHLWDLSQGKPINNYKNIIYKNVVGEKSHFSSTVSSIAFSQDEKHVFISSGAGGQTVSLQTGQKVHDFPYSYHAALSPDGRFILRTWNENKELWDANNGKKIRDYEEHDGLIESVYFSPDSRYFLSTRHATVKLWETESGKEVRVFTNRWGHWVWESVFSADGKYILTGHSHYATLWETYTGKKVRNFTKDRYRRFRAKHYAIQAMAFSPDGQYILTGSGDNMAQLWETNSGKELAKFTGHGGPILSVAFSSDGKYVFTSSEDKTSKIWNLRGEELLTLIATGDDKWISVRLNGYYMASSKGSNLINFKIGAKLYNFEQFDLRLNRPDKILEPLLPFGADSSLMLRYRNAYYKRLSTYGFTEDMLSDDYHVPTCEIQNQSALPISITESTLTLNILATDSLRPLDRLNVFVNDVPIYGIAGINLREQNIQEYSTTLNIPLSQGENKIQVSALNQGGAESLKATTYITYDAPARKPDLYLITIGVTDYQAEGKDLKYAAKDAQDIADLYQSNQAFDQIKIQTLTNAQVTKSNILALRGFLEQSLVDDQVLIYVSGHGLLDENYDFYYATHDIDFANPAEKGILYDEIEGLLDGIPARKKLLLMDACHSGEYDVDAAPISQTQQDSLKAKGIAYKGFSKNGKESAPVLSLQNSFEMMKQLFADLRRGSGATVISSSSGMQFSYEDSEWQNGIFTYVFLRGLKTMEADANGDGRVTASEIQAYVAEYVPRLTEGLQVPTFRRENLEYDFRVW